MADPRRTPVQVAPPPETIPFKIRAELTFREFFAPSSYRAATLRWMCNNIDQPRRCDCGAPGTVTVTDPGGGWLGSTPPTWWRCDEHATVPLTVPWSNGAPLDDQTPDKCTWSMGSSITHLITDCGCGTHIGDRSRP